MEPFIRIICLGFLFTLGHLLPAGLLYAQTAHQPSDTIFERVEKLKKLRTEDPAAYRRIIQDKRSRFKQNYQRFSQEGEGEAINEFVQREAAKKRERLKEIKRKNPEGFERMMDKRMNRMRNMASHNPQKFQQFMQKHPNMQKRFKQFQRKRPDQDHEDGLQRRTGQNQNTWSQSPPQGKNRKQQEPGAFRRQNQGDEHNRQHRRGPRSYQSQSRRNAG